MLTPLELCKNLWHTHWDGKEEASASSQRITLRRLAAYAASIPLVSSGSILGFWYAYLSSAFLPFSCLLPVNGPKQSVMLLLTSKIPTNKECMVRKEMMQSKVQRAFVYLCKLSISTFFPSPSCLLPVNGPKQSVMLLLTSKISVNKKCLERYDNSHLAESSKQVYKESVVKSILEDDFLRY
jgi:hypothetical protein